MTSAWAQLPSGTGRERLQCERSSLGRILPCCAMTGAQWRRQLKRSGLHGGRGASTKRSGVHRRNESNAHAFKRKLLGPSPQSTFWDAKSIDGWQKEFALDCDEVRMAHASACGFGPCKA